MDSPVEQSLLFSEMLSSIQEGEEEEEGEGEGEKKKGKKVSEKKLPSASKWVLRYVYALNIYFHPTDDPNMVVPQETYPTDTGMTRKRKRKIVSLAN